MSYEVPKPELAIIISYPTNTIIVLLKMPPTYKRKITKNHRYMDT